MSEFIARQYELGKRMGRCVENLKKTGTARINPSTIRARLDLLEGLWKDFNDNHNKILQISGDSPDLQEAPYFQKEYFETGEEAYVDQRGRLLELLAGCGTAAEAPSMSGDLGASAPSREVRSRAVLPRIELPKFDGRVQDWPSFRDLFVSLVIDDETLSEVERFHYLRSSIAGNAQRRIRNLPITGPNFRRAWDLLRDRFENVRLIVSAQINTLLTVAPVQSECANEIRRVIDITCDVVESLDAMGRPLTKPGDLLLSVVVGKLDGQTRQLWEASLGSSAEPPTFDQLRKFLDARINTLEALNEGKSTQKRPFEKLKPAGRSAKVLQTSPGKAKGSGGCPVCAQGHILMLCPQYRSWDPARRKKYVSEACLCSNCLGRHALVQCRSEKVCQHCQARHHSSLHDATLTGPGTSEVTTLSATAGRPSTVLLATAEVRVCSPEGQSRKCRVLLDSGSQISLISEDLVQDLRLRRQRSNLPLRGVSGSRTVVSKGVVCLDLTSRYGDTPRIGVQAYVLPALTSYQPPQLNQRELPAAFKNLQLADPDISSLRRVDLLLGAEVYPRLLLDGLLRDSTQNLIAQNTLLGWLLIGQTEPCRSSTTSAATSLQLSVDGELHSLVERFWRLEEVEVPHTKTPEDELCERQFSETCTRREDGRYVVRLPLKPDVKLGESRHIAEERMRALSRRLVRSPMLSQLYTSFMEEYLRLDHMRPCSRMASGPAYYLPHHGVHKASSTTTKLRVVFNASQKSSSGVSLNELVYKGPNLLPELQDILLRWRTHRVALVCDIEKMYRQIPMHPADWDYQRILWRNPTLEEELRDYQLCTVTYGLACAPFLAIRVVQQLARDYRDQYPRASAVLLRETYMDDILAGAPSVEEARSLSMELDRLCRAGGFTLQKWRSSDATIFGTHEDPASRREFRESEEASPILGVQWCSESDTFRIQFRLEGCGDRITKRLLLSQLSRLFDPIGWLAPVTVWAKCLLQELWLSGVGWDAPLPDDKVTAWKAFVAELPSLASLQLPRWLHTGLQGSRTELHGFADSSERAYAAVVYARTCSADGRVQVRMVGAKTKVAPLKRLSLPRLELNAALLLTRYLTRIVRSVQLQELKIHCWSDSTVTLHWVTSHPSKWKTYVANRVAELQTMLPDAIWHHVPGKQNPADVASRGLMPAQLPSSTLWWMGPSFLHNPAMEYPPLAVPISQEESRTVAHVTNLSSSPENDFLLRFSSLERLLRITCLCLRWRKRGGTGKLKGRGIGAAERRSALLRWVRLVQESHFPEELRALKNKSTLPRRSRLIHLSPFLDEEGVLRVQGRLRHSLLAACSKNPFILPPNSSFTEMYILSAHLQALHGGPQLTLAVVRQEAWPIRGRQLVKACIRRCLNCLRWTAPSLTQRMADLPSDRVRPSRPFSSVGVDYAGPINFSFSKGRGRRKEKGYIALFVCLSTRAVHLELVSGYDTDSFLAAFTRFVGRRGCCARIFSDCGTNFVGAARELREVEAALRREDSALHRFCSGRGIEWHFNPPAAPHFGGLWEAGVRAVKHHLRRVLGEQLLTYEEFATVLVGIEACLNSRPLQALSDDPRDLDVLTPGHFLIGDALTAPPETDLSDIPMNRLSRWQLLNRMVQHFWRRWSHEYLTALQPRSKWCETKAPPRVGDLMLLKNENLPPTRWPLCRITALHPGEDQLPRIATVRTATSELRRPITRLVPLPPSRGSNKPFTESPRL